MLLSNVSARDFIAAADIATPLLSRTGRNCFLATKLSYVNAIAELCERLGADVADVTEGLGYDKRIGQSYLSPGPGWGGSCLPKDTSALLQLADSVDFEFRLLRRRSRPTPGRAGGSSRRSRRPSRASATARCPARGSPCSVSRSRRAPATCATRPRSPRRPSCGRRGAELVAFDPAIPAEDSSFEGDLLTVVDDPYVAAKDADAIVILTEWPEFRGLDWRRLATVVKRPLVLDTRNLVDPDVLRRAGFSWSAVSRLAAG